MTLHLNCVWWRFFFVCQRFCLLSTGCLFFWFICSPRVDRSYRPRRRFSSLPQLTRQAECSRYFGQDLLRPVAYAGSVATRRRLAEQLGLAPDNVKTPGSAGVGTSAGKAGEGFVPKSGRGVGGVGRVDAGAESAAAVGCANVIVTSYNVLRTDAGVLGGQVREVQS